MKNICFIINDLSGAGAERVVLNLAEELVKLGHRVDIITLYNRLDYALDKNINLHSLEFNSHDKAIKNIKSNAILNAFSPLLRIADSIFKSTHFTNNKKTQILLAKIAMLNIDVDLFVSHLPDADQICIAAKLPNLYCCIHRGISDEIRMHSKNKLYYKIMQILRQKTYKNQHLIGVSAGVSRDILQLGIKPKSVQTIYNILDFAKIKNQAKKYQPTEQDYIICIGRLSKEKRFDILINAYKQANIKQKLLIFGQGAQQPNIQKLIDDLDLTQQVVLKGFKPNPYPYIKNAKALILSSDIEGLPTVLLEALVLGVPIVSSNCRFGPNEILTAELADFLSPVGDAAALAANIAKMIQSPIKIDAKFTAKFTKEVAIRKYLALCK
ncbi:MAG: glycosyltransferase [Candidatus Thioglobus sp.]|nr:MAG: glycosyltransferase [Candidatus Thioglobus sp.]KAA0447155.1 MAG: glycosyltransferase [Candidatus Thioglobus sp.]